MILTDAQLDVLEKHANSATPPPWNPVPHVHGSAGCMCLSCDDPVVGWFVDHSQAPDCADAVALRTKDGEVNGFKQQLASCDAGPLITFEDATFAAEARESVPQLIATARTLRALAMSTHDFLTALGTIHIPINSDSGKFCEVCAQEEEQPYPIGYWVPFPCETIIRARAHQAALDQAGIRSTA